MNFFDDITNLEAKEKPKEEPKENPKQEPKEEPKEQNNSFTELQAQITELKDMFKKFIEVNKGEGNNDN